MRLRFALTCSLPVPPPTARPKLVGLGSAALDFLAVVAAFPRPDAKLRTLSTTTQGGGNAANCLTAASRLGLASALWSKLGGDGNAEVIASELAADGVDASLCARGSAGSPSPFTYIIVDQSSSTRTCIHTPGEPATPGELPPTTVKALLDGATVAVFDGRLAECGTLLAAAARAQGLTVVVEAERLRPGLDELLSLADVVVTSQHYPEAATGETELGAGLVELAFRLPHARLLVQTLGARGAIALERLASDSSAPFCDATATLTDMEGVGTASAPEPAEVGALPVPSDTLMAAPGQFVRRPPVAAAAVVAAATAAAVANADAGNAASYAPSSGQLSGSALTARLLFTPPAVVAPNGMVDTTGAGDAFIGALCFALAHAMDTAPALRLAAWVAAAKCRMLGARAGLPRAAEVPPALLSGGELSWVSQREEESEEEVVGDSGNT